MMQDMELSIERLTELKGLGVQLAVDDFGTGYSSLNYIRRFPVDILKVDKSFVDGVSEGGEASRAHRRRDRARRHPEPASRSPRASSAPTSWQRLLELHCDLGPGLLLREAAAQRGAPDPAARAHRDAGRGRRPARRALHRARSIGLLASSAVRPHPPLRSLAVLAPRVGRHRAAARSPSRRPPPQVGPADRRRGGRRRRSPS